jgi:hypothetical protein
MISVGIVAIELLGYQVLVKLVPVLPRVHLLHHHPRLRATNRNLRPPTPGTRLPYPDLGKDVTPVQPT